MKTHITTSLRTGGCRCALVEDTRVGEMPSTWSAQLCKPWRGSYGQILRPQLIIHLWPMREVGEFARWGRGHRLQEPHLVGDSAWFPLSSRGIRGSEPRGGLLEPLECETWNTVCFRPANGGLQAPGVTAGEVSFLQVRSEEHRRPDSVRTLEHCAVG